MTNENAMFCYRPDNTCYAILSTYEWEKLRKAGTLDAELKRRRESGVVLEVVRPETKAPVKHFKPREETRVVRTEAPAETVARFPTHEAACDAGREHETQTGENFRVANRGAGWEVDIYDGSVRVGTLPVKARG